MERATNDQAHDVILLVENNPDHAELVRRLFESNEIPNPMCHLSDGEVVLEYLFRQNAYADPATSPLPCLVLLDLRLPKMDGLEILKMIKTTEELQSLPVVILTTSEAEQDVAQAYEYHANSYLVKPVDFQKFQELMTDLGFYWLSGNRSPWW